MKILVIPDIHNKVVRAEAVMCKHQDEVDRIILLGDYVDDYHDEPKDMHNTLGYMSSWQLDPGVTMLIGNHEASYMHPKLMCSGWTENKQQQWDLSVKYGVINPKQFKSHVLIDDLLFTHAGLAAEHITIDKQAADLDDFIANNTHHRSLQYHKHNGGPNDIGSIITARVMFNKLSDNYIQVFGHTQSKQPIVTRDADGNIRSLNLDTNLNHYAIITIDGPVTKYQFEIIPIENPGRNQGSSTGE